MAGKRSKRFEIEDDEVIPTFQLVEDDYAIMLYALRHRLITSKQLQRYFPHRSRDRIVRRLRTLMKNGLLDKPKRQAGIRVEGGGTLPHAVAVSDKGARLLAKHYKLDILGSNRSRDNQKLTPTSIQETLDTTDFSVLMHQSAAARSNVTLHDSFDILLEAPEKQRRKAKPKSFPVRIQWNGKNSIRGIEPDEIHHIHYSDRLEDQRSNAFFFVEIDRDTETVEPGESILKDERFFRQSYVLLKYIIYGSAFRAKKPLPFGFTTFRVLFITTTPTHMRRLQEVERRWLGSPLFKIPPGFVLFSNQDAVAAHADDLLLMPWEDGNGMVWFIDGRMK